jgi:hypothetical protein
LITASKFKGLMNGGGNVKVLTVEIAALEAESDGARAELCTIPAKRADLIMSDDPAAAITKLEGRERELELLLERNAMQFGPLKQRLSELRRVELGPRIKHHQDTLLGLMPAIEKAVRALKSANDAAGNALRDAIAELGDDGAHLMPAVHIGFVPPDVEMCLMFWRGQIDEQRARIARAQESDGRDVSRKPAFDLDALAKDPYVRGHLFR